MTVLASNGDSYLVNFGDGYLCPDGSTADAESLVTDDFKSISAAYYDESVPDGNWVLLNVLRSAGVTYGGAPIVYILDGDTIVSHDVSYRCEDGILMATDASTSEGGWFRSDGAVSEISGAVACDGDVVATEPTTEQFFIELAPLDSLGDNSSPVSLLCDAFSTLVLILQGHVNYGW